MISRSITQYRSSIQEEQISTNGKRNFETIEMSDKDNEALLETTFVSPSGDDKIFSDQVSQREVLCEELEEVLCTFNILEIGPNSNERKIIAKVETLNKQFEMYQSCLFHQKILKEANQRNEELIKVYQSCRDDLQGDERFDETRRLYDRLTEELIASNKKMTQIEKDLSLKSSINPEVYRTQKRELQKELSRLRDEKHNGMEEEW
jgi:hypothetical protein